MRPNFVGRVHFQLTFTVLSPLQEQGPRKEERIDLGLAKLSDLTWSYRLCWCLMPPFPAFEAYCIGTARGCQRTAPHKTRIMLTDEQVTAP